jgi:hypothetical protein
MTAARRQNTKTPIRLSRQKSRNNNYDLAGQGQAGDPRLPIDLLLFSLPFVKALCLSA